MAKKIIVISGPTGVGKTKLALEVARKYNLAVLNADASQMRKYMDIGTANVTSEEIQGLKNYMFKALAPTEEFSIKDYQEKARNILEENERIIIVGGSGLYIDSLLLDYDLSSQARKVSESSLSNEELYKKLCALDPEAAKSTHANNRKRVLRYLELASEAGHVEKKEPVQLYDCLYITLDDDRENLYKRIERRCDQMFENGWIDEAQDLIEKGYDLNNIKEIGYKEIGMYLNGDMSKEDLLEEIKKETRHYAKRQLTWFRGDAKKYNDYHVINITSEEDKAKSIIDEYMNK